MKEKRTESGCGRKNSNVLRRFTEHTQHNKAEMSYPIYFKEPVRVCIRCST